MSGLKIFIDPSPEYTRELTMAISAELAAKFATVLDVIGAESAEVAEALAALKAEIEALKLEVANGLKAEEVIAELDNLIAGVDGIYEPEVVEEPTPVDPEPLPPAVE